MLKNQLLVALRNLWRNKGISIIINLVISWLTIAFLVAKVSRTSPAEALKYE